MENACSWMRRPRYSTIFDMYASCNYFFTFAVSMESLAMSLLTRRVDEEELIMWERREFYGVLVFLAWWFGFHLFFIVWALRLLFRRHGSALCGCCRRGGGAAKAE